MSQSTTKMPQPQRTSSATSDTDGMRKRVCKACDRCRLKKSKCDGSHPCSRCKADNAICVFGERKKSHDKVYPKGYVEMLEQQQGQLVAGLQEMYKRLLAAQKWPGPPLSETSGQPLTHDILAALNLLELRIDGSGEAENFEEDFEKLQKKLLANGSGYVQRRNSYGSDSDHSSHDHSRKSSKEVSVRVRPALFKCDYSWSPSPATTLPSSPVTQQRPPFSPSQQSPLHPNPALAGGVYQPNWALPDFNSPEAFMRQKQGMLGAQFSQNLGEMDDIVVNEQWDQSPIPYDLGMDGLASYQPTVAGGYAHGNFPTTQDFTGLDPMEVDFSKFIQVTT